MPSSSAEVTMVDGLKLTLTGEQGRRLLGLRIEAHEVSVAWWKRKLAQKPEEQTDDDPLMPDHICEHEAERHQWRIEVLGFIRDHVDASETYRLAGADLEFGELLPRKPGWLVQEEYEERTNVGFQLERLTKKIDWGVPWSCPDALSAPPEAVARTAGEREEMS
jgi:hypothetical protein